MNCIIPVAENNDFTIYNIPFGIYSHQSERRMATRIGDKVIDLFALAELGVFNGVISNNNIFKSDFLNPLIELGKPTTKKVREKIQHFFSDESNQEKINASAQKITYPIEEVTLHLPVKVGDYTDFYSSIEHATNVGTMFRDPNNALLPNWKHLPVGYHGRASSIIISGTPIHRPKGQTKPNADEPPVFGPCKLLDFELEMAFITFNGKPLGQPITTQEADEYIFGMVVFNDWSARDIQTWEYVPLGPFLSKNFASSVSPWVVTTEALEPFRVEGPEQNPTPLPYLQYSGKKNIDIQLEVFIQPENAKPTRVSVSNYKYMYWNMNQQLAHHTINGCNINTGDMMASGTISGPSPNSYGSMLELTWRGTKPIKMEDGSERKFINDFDTVSMKAYCIKDSIRVGFGEVYSKVLPAL
ncbi:MAG: fumarylacetoacetase [Flavobacteriales bacterium]|nr:fumarylacetoacetase [Flavobacteriales bacterium]